MCIANKERLFEAFARDKWDTKPCEVYMDEFRITLDDLLDLFGEYWRTKRPPVYKGGVRNSQTVMIEETGEVFLSIKDCERHFGDKNNKKINAALDNGSEYHGYHVRRIGKRPMVAPCTSCDQDMHSGCQFNCRMFTGWLEYEEV